MAPIFKELWKYSLARRRWAKQQVFNSLPDQLASSAVCLSGRALMLFGGTGTPFGHRCSNRLFTYNLYDPDCGFELARVKGSLPPPQYGQATFCNDGYLYAVGGTDGQLYSIDIHRLNLATMTWETVFTSTGNRADEPEARYRHELVLDGNLLYILAGGTADQAYDFINVPVFNLQNFSWTFKKSISDAIHGYPAPRKCHSAVQIECDGAIQAFVMGGFDNIHAYNDLWKLQIPSLQWTLMTKSHFPRPLYFHSSAVTPEGCMYTFGGIFFDHGVTRRSDKLYKVWLCVPKLSEMCWEYIINRCPRVLDAQNSELLGIGVPLRFVERLHE